MTYRAVVCADWGLPEALQVRELPTAPPRPGCLAIDVACCGVNVSHAHDARLLALFWRHSF